MLVLGGYPIFFLMGFISYKWWLLPDFSWAMLHYIAPCDDLRFPHGSLNLWDLGSNFSRSKLGRAIDRVSELNNEKLHWKVLWVGENLSFIWAMNMYIYMYIYTWVFTMHLWFANGPVSGYADVGMLQNSLELCYVQPSRCIDESPTSILGNEVPRTTMISQVFLQPPTRVVKASKQLRCNFKV